MHRANEAACDYQREWSEDSGQAGNGGAPRIRGFASWLWDVPADKVRFSEEWRHIILAPDDELLEREVSSWWPELVHEDDVLPFLRAAKAVYEGKSDEYQTLFRVRRCDGAWAWILSRGVVSLRQGGRPVFVSGAAMDVSCLRTDLKFQHGNLKTLPLGEALLENSPDAFVRLDKHLFPLYANPALTAYLKPSGNSLRADRQEDGSGLNPEFFAMLERNVNKVFREKTAVREHLTFSTEYGHDIVGEYAFWPELDADGNVVAAMTQFRDITDHMLHDRRARLNERRLEALYQVIRMDNALADDLQRFVVETIVDITESESGFVFFPEDNPERRGKVLWSRSLYGLVDNADLPDETTAAQLAALVDAEPGNTTVRIIRNGTSLQPVSRPFSGKIKVLRFISVPVTDNGRIVCVACVCNKRTEYRQADLQQLEAFVNGAWFILRRNEFVRQLKQAKEQAEAATRTMSEFLTNVNHELRTPLTSILGYAETLIQLGPEEEQFRNRCIEVIQLQAMQMHKLVLDLLNLSRIEGSAQLDLSPASVEDLVNEAMHPLIPLIKEKRLNVVLNVPDGLEIQADRHFISLVFYNLMENAVIYSYDGTDILVEASVCGRDVVISFEDEGITLDPDEHERIFDRFFRGKHYAGRHAGTGVGLSICKQVVKRHGGHIWVDRLEKGIRISFALPH